MLLYKDSEEYVTKMLHIKIKKEIYKNKNTLYKSKGNQKLKKGNWIK